jgi:hypothetical protein
LLAGADLASHIISEDHLCFNHKYSRGVPTVRNLFKIRNNETTDQLYKVIEENKTDNRITV